MLDEPTPPASGTGAAIAAAGRTTGGGTCFGLEVGDGGAFYPLDEAPVASRL